MNTPSGMNAPSVTRAAPENPYVGPRPFTQAEAHLFFGREAEARNLLSLVLAEQLVLFYAQSGAGKSSLINARLVPELQKRDFETLPVGRVSGESQETPETANIYIYNLLVSLDESKTDPGRFTHLRLSDFLANLACADGKFLYQEPRDRGDEKEGEKGEGRGESAEAAPIPSPLPPIPLSPDYELLPRVLIIDQFEELFTTHPEAWEKREDFFGQIAEAMQADPELWVVLAMREDYIALLDPYVHLLPGRLRARFYMQRMGYKAALEAITLPVKDLRPFTPGVAELLVDNLVQITPGRGGAGLEAAGSDGKPASGQGTSGAGILGEFVEPVQLQVVCFQLWKNLPPAPAGEQGQITQEDLLHLAQEAAPGAGLAEFVNNALAGFYEQALNRITSDPSLGISERELRAWFGEKLITEAGTRGFVYMGEEKTAGLPNTAVFRLAGQYILRGETKAGGTWFELVHDRFIGPILQSNRAWEATHQSALSLAALAWEGSGRNPAKLLEGNALKTALQDTQNLELSPREREFLKASQESAQQAEGAAMKVRIEEEQRTNERLRRRNRLIGSLAVVLTFAALAALFSFYLANRSAAAARSASTSALNNLATAQVASTQSANSAAAASTAGAQESIQRATAQAASTQAVANLIAAQAASTQALAQQATAVAAAQEAKRQANLAGARTLAAQASYYFNSQPDLASLLSVEAYNLDPSWETKSALLNQIQFGLQNTIQQLGGSIPSQGADVVSVALSPDGQRAAWGLSNGTVVIGNYRTMQEEERANRHQGQFVYSVAFSPDGRFLASGGDDGSISVEDLQTGEVTPSPSDRRVFRIFSVAFSPKDSQLLAYSSTKQVGIWNLATGEFVNFPEQSNIVNGISWSPTGEFIASAGADGTVRIWSATTGKDTIMRLGAGGVDSVAWSPDGNLLAWGEQMGRLAVWDLGAKAILTSFQVPTSNNRIYSLAWSADSQLLAYTAGANIGLWSRAQNKVLDSIGYHARLVHALAFSPARGKTLLLSGSYDDNLGLFAINQQQNLGQEKYTINGAVVGIGQDQGKLFALALPPGAGPVLHTLPAGAQTTIQPETPSGMVVALSPLGDRVAMGNLVARLSLSGTLGIRQVGGLQITWRSPNGLISALAFNSDESRLASAHCQQVTDEDGQLTCRSSMIQIWNTANGELIQALPFTKTTLVSSLAFSPQGDILAAGSEDGRIFRVDLTSGAPVGLPLASSAGKVLSLAFSQDGLTLASGTSDYKLILWDLEVGQPIGAPLEGFSDPVVSLKFTPDGNLYGGTAGGVVLLWETNFDRWKERVCFQAGRNLSKAEWNLFMPGQEYRKTCEEFPSGS